MNITPKNARTVVFYPIYDQSEEILSVLENLDPLMADLGQPFRTHMITEGYKSNSRKVTSFKKLTDKARKGANLIEFEASVIEQGKLLGLGVVHLYGTLHISTQNTIWRSPPKDILFKTRADRQRSKTAAQRECVTLGNKIARSPTCLVVGITFSELILRKTVIAHVAQHVIPQLFPRLLLNSLGFAECNNPHIEFDLSSPTCLLRGWTRGMSFLDSKFDSPHQVMFGQQSLMEPVVHALGDEVQSQPLLDSRNGLVNGIIAWFPDKESPHSQKVAEAMRPFLVPRDESTKSVTNFGNRDATT